MAVESDPRKAAFIAAQNLQRAGRLAEAERAWRELENTAPGHAGVAANLAMVLWQLNKFEAAEAAAGRALAAAPDMVQARAVYAACAEALGRVDEAIERYLHTLAIAPTMVTVLHGLTNLYRRRGDLNSAATFAQRMTEAAPDQAAAWDAFGAVLLAKNDLEGAEAALKKAVAHDPSFVSAEANLGVLAAERRRWPEALAHAERALAIGPVSAETHNNRANALISLGLLDEAAVAFEEALALDPSSHDARFNRSLLWLKQGKWRDAWPDFEARWQTRRMAPFRRDFQEPVWDGADAQDRVLLVHAEQGMGDMLMMARYLPIAAAKVGKMVIECHGALVELIAGMGNGFEVVAAGDPLPAFDMHLPAMSLPRMFETDTNTVPWNGPYLSMGQAALNMVPGDGFKVGLVWAGNPGNPTDPERSIALRELMPLLDTDDVAFCSLQHGPEGDQIAANGLGDKIADLRPYMTDFASTARLVAELDLVLSICTSVAHLAGGMGAPLWVLLSADPDWRWLRGRDSSPWYPTARLFRQEAPGEWGTVVSKAKVALEGKVAVNARS